MFRWLRRGSTPPVASSGYRLPSTLWLDSPGAQSRIREMEQRGAISAGEARRLADFMRDGFTILRPEISEATFTSLERDVDHLWKSKPWSVAYAHQGPAYPMAYADESRERRRRSRIHDIHSASDAALSLYLHPEIFRFVRLILDEEPLAFQSLYFQFGSEQVIHRDPVVVPTAAPGHLVAAWIALEDIRPGSGELIYVPGSHRLPYFEFSPGEWQFDAYRMGEREIEQAREWDRQQMKLHGLEARTFTPSKGEVLIWHASLMHGGAAVASDELTRKSYVVHYSTASTYRTRAITVHEKVTTADGEHEVPRVVGTETILESDGCRGLDNPMRTFGPGA